MSEEEKVARDENGMEVFPETPTVVIDEKSGEGRIVFGGWQLYWYISRALGNPQWWVWLRQWIEEPHVATDGPLFRWKTARSNIVGSNLRLKDVDTWVKGLLKELEEDAQEPLEAILKVLEEERRK